jgi:NAD(P)-dependent dehydrogenase (short-subunit alcohol dehydrogenase family)
MVGMTLPMARDLAQHGIRVCTIAPGLFATPLMKDLPEAVQAVAGGVSIPFPKRLGHPEEFASLACHIVTNTAPQRRSHPPGRRAAHGAALTGRR